MEESKDVLAVYRDGTAPFFSYAGSAAFYDAHDQKCDQLCRQIIAAADQILAAPKGAAFPDDGNYPRITVLTLSGEVIAGTASPINSLLLLGAQLIRLHRSHPALPTSRSRLAAFLPFFYP